MAKYDEGDKQWIVEERPDGTNVHNWNWFETNCLEWSKTFFTNFLSNLVILNGEGNLLSKTTALRNLDGEAYINIRKGKIIPGYEVNLTFSWEGEAKDSEGKSLLKVNSTVEIAYISDENAYEDPDIRVTVEDKGPIGKMIKDVMFSKWNRLILEKVRVWVQSMAKGGPVKEELDTKKPLSQSLKQNHAPATVVKSDYVKKEGVVEKNRESSFFYVWMLSKIMMF